MKPASTITGCRAILNGSASAFARISVPPGNVANRWSFHTRSASDDTLRLMREERAEEVGGVMHCFTET